MALYHLIIWFCMYTTLWTFLKWKVVYIFINSSNSDNILSGESVHMRWTEIILGKGRLREGIIILRKVYHPRLRQVLTKGLTSSKNKQQIRAKDSSAGLNLLSVCPLGLLTHQEQRATNTCLLMVELAEFKIKLPKKWQGLCFGYKGWFWETLPEPPQ